MADAGCWGEDEGSSGDTSDQSEWEEGDIVVLVSSGDRRDTLKVENERDWEVGDVSGVEDDAVDAGSQNRGICLNREIVNDILVHDAAVGERGRGVLWGEVAEEAEWKVGGEGVDGERQERGDCRDIVEAVEEEKEWAVGEERDGGNIV